MIPFPPRFGPLREEPPAAPGPARKEERVPCLEPGLGFGRVRGRSGVERCAPGRARCGDVHRHAARVGSRPRPRGWGRTPPSRPSRLGSDTGRPDPRGPGRRAQGRSRGPRGTPVVPVPGSASRPLAAGAGDVRLRARTPGPGWGRLPIRRGSRDAPSGPAHARRIRLEVHLRVRMDGVTLRAVCGHGSSSRGRPGFVTRGSEIRGRKSEVR